MILYYAPTACSIAPHIALEEIGAEFEARRIDLAKGELVSFSELLEELLLLIREDAEALGCVREVEHVRTILARGTSAHRQVAIYEQARARGASAREALQAVVNFLVSETAAGLGA